MTQNVWSTEKKSTRSQMKGKEIFRFYAPVKIPTVSIDCDQMSNSTLNFETKTNIFSKEASLMFTTFLGCPLLKNLTKLLTLSYVNNVLLYGQMLWRRTWSTPLRRWSRKNKSQGLGKRDKGFSRKIKERKWCFKSSEDRENHVFRKNKTTQEMQIANGSKRPKQHQEKRTHESHRVAGARALPVNWGSRKRVNCVSNLSTAICNS